MSREELGEAIHGVDPRVRGSSSDLGGREAGLTFGLWSVLPARLARWKLFREVWERSDREYYAAVLDLAKVSGNRFGNLTSIDLATKQSVAPHVAHQMLLSAYFKVKAERMGQAISQCMLYLIPIVATLVALSVVENRCHQRWSEMGLTPSDWGSTSGIAALLIGTCFVTYLHYASWRNGNLGRVIASGFAWVLAAQLDAWLNHSRVSPIFCPLCFMVALFTIVLLSVVFAVAQWDADQMTSPVLTWIALVLIFGTGALLCVDLDRQIKLVPGSHLMTEVAIVLWGALLSLLLALTHLFAARPRITRGFDLRAGIICPRGALIDSLTEALSILEKDATTWQHVTDRSKLLGLLDHSARVLRYGLPAVLTDKDAVTKNELVLEAERAGEAIRALKLWVLLPRTDTRERLIERVTETLIHVCRAEWDCLERRDPDREARESLERSRTGRRVRSVFWALSPLCLLLAIQHLTSMAPTPTTNALAAAAATWAAVRVLFLFDPDFKDAVGVFKSVTEQFGKYAKPG